MTEIHKTKTQKTLDKYSDPHRTLNRAEPGDVIEISYSGSGGGVFRVDTVVEKFGDGHGMLICRNDHDDIVTLIREKHRDAESVAIERGKSRSDAQLTATGVSAEIL